MRSSRKSDGEGVAQDPVALVLERLQLDERLLDPALPLQVVERRGQPLARA